MAVSIYRSGGITLPELLVTLTVISILAVGLADFLPRFIYESRMVSTVNRFVAALHLGRSEAIKRGRQVVLCPSRDHRRCGDSLAWPEGWLLFQSLDREHGEGDTLVQAGNPLGHGIGLYASNYRKRIAWQADGTSGGSNSSFTFCSQYRRVKPRVICLSNTGRPRLSATRCDGKPVICP